MLLNLFFLEVAKTTMKGFYILESKASKIINWIVFILGLIDLYGKA